MIKEGSENEAHELAGRMYECLEVISNIKSGHFKTHEELVHFYEARFKHFKSVIKTLHILRFSRQNRTNRYCKSLDKNTVKPECMCQFF